MTIERLITALWVAGLCSIPLAVWIILKIYRLTSAISVKRTKTLLREQRRRKKAAKKAVVTAGASAAQEAVVPTSAIPEIQPVFVLEDTLQPVSQKQKRLLVAITLTPEATKLLSDIKADIHLDNGWISAPHQKMPKLTPAVSSQNN